MTTALGLLAVLLLVLGTGYFVAAEFAFVAVRRGRLEELAAQGDRRAVRAVAVHRRLSFMLSGAQLGITVTTLALGFIAEPTLGRLLEPLLRLTPLSDAAAFAISLSAAFVIATTGSMVLGELAPKNLAIAEPEMLALRLARFTHFYTRVASPIIKFFDGASNGLLKMFGIQPVDELSGGVSADELEYIIEDASRGGSLRKDTAGLLRRSLDFRDLRAGAAMVTRNHVDHIPADARGAELRELALRTGHSRFPVTDEDLDDVIGFVQAKDLLRLPPGVRDATPVRNLLKPVVAVPESALLGPLLGDMRRSHNQLAVVVDEYGGTAGIVTLEDIVEELVGSIQDEYDPAEPVLRRTESGSYLVPGQWRVDEAIRETGVELPEGDYETLGGLIMERLGRVPVVGDQVRTDIAFLRVEAMDGHAVTTVALTPLAGEPAS